MFLCSLLYAPPAEMQNNPSDLDIRRSCEVASHKVVCFVPGRGSSLTGEFLFSERFHLHHDTGVAGNTL